MWKTFLGCRCTMSGGNHKFHGRVLSPLNSGLMFLTARNKWICQTEPHILMAALQKPGKITSCICEY